MGGLLLSGGYCPLTQPSSGRLARARRSNAWLRALRMMPVWFSSTRYRRSVSSCADGSNYDMPQVTCAQGAQSIADCTGSYGNERFPMSMRRAGE